MRQGKKVLTYTVIIHPDDGGFSVYFPDVSGCFSCGDTYDEAFENAQNALEEYLAACSDFGKPIPEPKSRAETLTVKSS